MVYMLYFESAMLRAMNFVSVVLVVAVFMVVLAKFLRVSRIPGAT
jgi:hypothetical protein